MKKLIVVLLVIVLVGCAPKENCMAIEFDGNGNIDFGAIVNNQTIRTVSAWIYLDSVAAGKINNFVYHTGQGWYFGADNDDLVFTQSFTTTAGQWARQNVLTTGLWHHIAVTYDGSLATNDPVIYLNGETGAQYDANGSGTMGDDSDGRLWIGGYTGMGAGEGTDGKLQDVRVYNRILSANEVSALYNSRCLRNVMNGLVFWAPMWGADSATFDGLTLTAAHVVRDWAGGASGVPTGSPIGRGNTFQGN